MNLLACMGEEAIVRIQEADKLTCGSFDTSIARSGNASVTLMYDPHATVTLSPLSQFLP